MASPSTPAAPPTRQEIERKLSVHAASPSPGKMTRKMSLPLSTSPTGVNILQTSPGAAPTSPGAQQPQQQHQHQAAGATTTAAQADHPHPPPQPPQSNLTRTLSPSTSQTLSAISETDRAGGSNATTPTGGAAFLPRAFSDSENEDYEGDEESDEEDGALHDDNGEDSEMRRKVEGERILRSGFLDKKGEKRKTWKKRWFVLRTEKLSYYKDDREYKLLRLIDLRDIHTVSLVQLKKHSAAFGIVTRTRTYYVKARSLPEAESWVEAINSARREVKERDQAKEEAAAAGAAVGGEVGAGGTAPSLGRRLTGSSHPHPQHLHQAPQYAGGPPPPGGANSTAGMGGISISPSQQRPSPPSSSYGSSPAPSQLFGTSFSSSTFSSSFQSSAGANPGNLRVNPSAAPPPALSLDFGVTYTSPTELRHNAPPVSPTQLGATSSSEDDDEAFFNGGIGGLSLGTSASPSPASAMAVETQRQQQQLAPQSPRPVVANDPNKIILSGYLMKLGKRKTWRKRWFVLTSGSLVYTSSHMDTKPHRVFPLFKIVDALEYEPAPKEPSALQTTLGRSPLPTSSLSSGAGGISGSDGHFVHDTHSLDGGGGGGGAFAGGAGGSGRGTVKVEHSFKVITPKKTLILCAPSEEEEIKWLSALQALIARRTGGGRSASAPTPAPVSAPATAATTLGFVSGGVPMKTRSASGGSSIPIIHEQPPSPPALSPDAVPSPTTVSLGHSYSTQQPLSASAHPRNPSPTRFLPSIEAQLGPSPMSAALGMRSGSESDGPSTPQQQQQQQQQEPLSSHGMRERSDTAAGKEAVENVRRFYHPDQEGITPK